MLQLFAHPFSSYCQKALIAFYENDVAFEWRMLGQDDPENLAEWSAAWPIKRMPMLRDGDKNVVESTVIIEYLQLAHPGPVRLLPKNPADALETRMMDRFFDNYIMIPMQKVVFNAIRPEADRDPYGVDQARSLLDDAYGWLDGVIAGRTWAAGEDYSLADCAASPSLFYADWVHPIADRFENVRAYRNRLLERPSFARAVDEARPYRSFFPLGAPDRD
ncbi:glutathione S-transferase [Pararhizobium capsulatum DSM 1112]|uniref:Glutathione S-transferase n=1 Tax=Pararhizobium capsulatum DSM 1112 TaxID=1121113 RepID=A0ABU0BTJ6_9HYPH|nr:glutathione S-transferase family protein [Pararhizobium capsulatum]MDQ0321573.1 glutathione S-transferase [Pararhizobium capsulatum DSM 1112]